MLEGRRNLIHPASVGNARNMGWWCRSNTHERGVSARTAASKQVTSRHSSDLRGQPIAALEMQRGHVVKKLVAVCVERCYYISNALNDRPPRTLATPTRARHKNVCRYQRIARASWWIPVPAQRRSHTVLARNTFSGRTWAPIIELRRTITGGVPTIVVGMVVRRLMRGRCRRCRRAATRD